MGNNNLPASVTVTYIEHYSHEISIHEVRDIYFNQLRCAIDSVQQRKFRLSTKGKWETWRNCFDRRFDGMEGPAGY